MLQFLSCTCCNHQNIITLDDFMSDGFVQFCFSFGITTIILFLFHGMRTPGLYPSIETREAVPRGASPISIMAHIVRAGQPAPESAGPQLVIGTNIVIRAGKLREGCGVRKGGLPYTARVRPHAPIRRARSAAPLGRPTSLAASPLNPIFGCMKVWQVCLITFWQLPMDCKLLMAKRKGL